MHIEQISIRTYFLIFILLASWMASGCATGKDAINLDQKEDLLRSEAERYWNARIEADYATAYSLEDKDGLPELADYRLQISQMLKMNVQSFSIEGISIDGLQATLKVNLFIRLPVSAKPVPNLITDTWIFRKGKWLHKFSI